MKRGVLSEQVLFSLLALEPAGPCYPDPFVKNPPPHLQPPDHWEISQSSFSNEIHELAGILKKKEEFLCYLLTRRFIDF